MYQVYNCGPHALDLGCAGEGQATLLLHLAIMSGMLAFIQLSPDLPLCWSTLIVCREWVGIRLSIMLCR